MIEKLVARESWEAVRGTQSFNRLIQKDITTGRLAAGAKPDRPTVGSALRRRTSSVFSTDDNDTDDTWDVKSLRQ